MLRYGSDFPHDTYKNQAYARQETENLADQLTAYKAPPVERTGPDAQTP
jgi:hypothetical protein